MSDPRNASGTGSSANAAGRPQPEFVGIVYLGMNRDANAEWKLLWEANKDRGVAKMIADTSTEDVLEHNGVRYDLNRPEEVRAFVETLRLEPGIVETVCNLIQEQFPDAKDEVAQLCFVYGQAERGERQMERVVLSGHSSGDVLWGDDNGLIMFQLFEQLAELFPRAAGQVRDLMISACYTGGERQIETYRRMFPNVESIWAYAGSSPGTWSGALDHMRIWEKATELSTPAELSLGMAANTRKGDRVAVWTKANGYVGGEPLTLIQAEYAVQNGEAAFERFFLGQEEVVDPQAGPLRNYYNDVQRLLAHPQIDPSTVPGLEHRRDVTIRLLFYGLVRQKFMAAFNGQLEAGYRKAGQAMPDFGRLSRGEALRAIAAFATPAKTVGGAAGEALGLLEQGLRDLSPAVVPSNWV